DLGKLSLSDRTIVNLVLAPARREDLTREQDGLVVTQLGLFERMVNRGTGFDCKRGFDPGPIGSLANVLCAHTRSRRRRHRSDYDRLSRPRLAGKYREPRLKLEFEAVRQRKIAYGEIQEHRPSTPSQARSLAATIEKASTLRPAPRVAAPA